jgi:hypothetical protein
MRHLLDLGVASLVEVVPQRGLRVDVMGLGPKGEIRIIECKSSRADFMSDGKWHRYLDWCDRFFWAVGADFPQEVLPPNTGIIIADAYGAETLRAAPLDPLAPARRKALLRNFAATAANRLQMLTDPVPR